MPNQDRTSHSDLLPIACLKGRPLCDSDLLHRFNRPLQPERTSPRIQERRKTVTYATRLDLKG
jgi:hypothetical protein